MSVLKDGPVDIVMPVVTLPDLLPFAVNAVKTCTETCKARLFLMDNGGEQTEGRREFGRWAVGLGHRYHFVDDIRPFNIWRYFNRGAELTAGPGEGQVIFFCGMDETFHPGWMDNLLELWDENPQYYCVAPYTASTAHLGVFYRRPEAPPERRLVPCDHPAPGIHGIRRSDWEPMSEDFGFWNSDYDFFEWMKARGKLGAIAYNSRVDHLIGCVRDRAPEVFGFDLNGTMNAVDRQFRAKWNKE